MGTKLGEHMNSNELSHYVILTSFCNHFFLVATEEVAFITQTPMDLTYSISKDTIVWHIYENVEKKTHNIEIICMCEFSHLLVST